MPNWKSLEITYLYDGSFDGLLTIVFDCFVNKTIPLQIFPTHSYVYNILDTVQLIETDDMKAQRVFKGIEANISYDVLYNAYQAFLCECGWEQKELQILKFLYHGFEIGPSINTMLSIDYVLNVHKMKKRAFGECHRLKGLLRFIEIGNNLYYSSIHPDNNIIEPLGQHFIRRLQSQNFIIHDKIRNIAFLYNSKEYQIVDSKDFVIPEISNTEKLYQDLWKLFFQTISIKERKNARCQMQYMPKKYWQDLIEEP